MSAFRPTAIAVTPRPVHAVSYIRVRPDPGSSSIAEQREAIQAYAATRGIEIVREYSDDAAGDGDPNDRPAYHQLLSDLRHVPLNFSTILIADWTRWLRSLFEDDEIAGEALLRRSGITLAAVGPPSPTELTGVADTLLTMSPAITPIVLYLPATDLTRHEAISDALLTYACAHAMSVLYTYHDDASQAWTGWT
jgi:hypothetical protein